jgi:hypothetical protein
MEILTFKQVEVGTRPCKDRKKFHAIPISLLAMLTYPSQRKLVRFCCWVLRGSVDPRRGISVFEGFFRRRRMYLIRNCFLDIVTVHLS